MTLRFQLVRVAAWFGFVFFGLASGYAIWTQQWNVLPFLVPMSLWGLFSLACFGRVEFNENGLKHWTWFGQYDIRWDEVTHLEINQEQQLSGPVLLRGEGNKRLTILGPSHWSDSHREEALEFFMRQIERHQIEVVPRKRFWPMASNTKVV